jgi:hypothetical protein
LAKYFGVSPLIFLEMGITEVRLHLERTIELAEITQREQEGDG